jgi:hypothetical protein
VPEVPRVAFGGGEYLFKFQVAASLSDDGGEGSVGLKFLAEFLPVFENHVFDRLRESQRGGARSAEDHATVP